MLSGFESRAQTRASFRSKHLNRYINISQLINGDVTSIINVNGYLNSPNIYGDIYIKHPTFDKIQGQHLSALLKFNNDVLYLSNIDLRTKDRIYSGRINLPIDISLNKLNFEILKNNEVDMSIIGRSSNMELLTPYIDNIENIDGAISWQ